MIGKFARWPPHRIPLIHHEFRRLNWTIHLMACREYTTPQDRNWMTTKLSAQLMRGRQGFLFIWNSHRWIGHLGPINLLNPSGQKSLSPQISKNVNRGGHWKILVLKLRKILQTYFTYAFQKHRSTHVFIEKLVLIDKTREFWGVTCMQRGKNNL